MTEATDGALAGVKMAVTVDDQFQWSGVPFAEGWSPRRVSKAMIDAFAEHDVRGVYAFNSTAASLEHPGGLDILDDWCAAGHYVGNHTHEHLSLNWMDVDTYLKDMDTSERMLSRWIEASPTRYFRYAYAMEGDTEDKTRQVQSRLTKSGYLSNPVTMWFYDAQFMIAYNRAVALSDRNSIRWLEDSLVDTALSLITSQAAASARALGRSPAHILLIHGTAIAGATVERILGRLAEAGVVFVTSEEAMQDPANVIGPQLTTRKFRNVSQKYAELAGDPIPDMPPAILDEVERTAVIKGMAWADVLGAAMRRSIERLPCTPVAGDFH